MDGKGMAARAPPGVPGFILSVLYVSDAVFGGLFREGTEGGELDRGEGVFLPGAVYTGDTVYLGVFVAFSGKHVFVF